MLKEVEQLKNIRQIDIELTKKCNYECDYCSVGSGLDKNHRQEHMDNKTIENLKRLFKKISSNSGICFLGGEPTMHPRFQEIAKTVLELRHFLTIFTNFSLPNNIFYSLIDICRYQNQLRLMLSLHLSQISSPDDFLKKVFELKEYAQEKINITVTAVVSDEDYNVLKIIKEKLAIKNIPLLFHHKKSKEHTPVVYRNMETKNLFNEQTTGVGSGKNNYLVKCNAGSKYIFITEKGDIARCADYLCVPNSLLGNINKKIMFPKKPQICLAPRCVCQASVAPDFL